MREREPKELQRFVIDRAPIQDDEDVFVGPALQGFLDERPVEIRDVDEFVGQPAPDLRDAPSGLRLARNVLGDLTQMHGVRQDQADNDPDPIGDPFQVGFRMDRAQFRKHAGVQFLTTAHETAPSVWCGNHRLCQFHEHFAKC